MRKQIRGISAGTVVMLAVTVLSVIGFILVMNRLSGKGADLSRLQMSALKLETEAVPDTGDILIVSADTQEMRADSAENTAPAGLPADAAEDAGTAARNSLTLTFGGTVAVESGIRKSCYAADSKKYDFSLLLNLMRDEFRGEGTAVFLENLLTDNAKMTDTVIPANAAEMLSEAGINLAAAGFAKAFDQGLDGLQATQAIRAMDRPDANPAGSGEPGSRDPPAGKPGSDAAAVHGNRSCVCTENHGKKGRVRSHSGG